MKNIKNSFYILFTVAVCLVLFSSCKKLAGLKLYKDTHYTGPDTLVAQQGVNAWDYLNRPRADTLFNQMIRGIKYAGLEEEYKKGNRTYILLINTAIRNPNSAGVENITSFFGRNLVNGKAGKRWEDYPVAVVRDLLQYHIIEGYYNFYNLPNPGLDERTPINVLVKTLRNDTAKPDRNKLYISMNIGNSAGFSIRFNDFPGSVKVTVTRTHNLQLLENSVAHVVPTYMEYGVL